MMINSDNTRFEAAATIAATEAATDEFLARQVTIPVLMVTADAADTLLTESGAQVWLKGDTVNVAVIPLSTRRNVRRRLGLLLW